MRAVVLRAFGSPGNLKSECVPEPAPAPGEVLLKVRSCGVCFHDVINRRGDLPRTRVPAILGHEVAGEVVALGEGVAGWTVGDGAASLQRLSCGSCAPCRSGRGSLCKTDTRFFGEEIPGGYAEFMAAPVAGLGKVPAGLPWASAATTCCTTGTAVHCVRTRGKVRKGERVLVTGASGGVGLQSVQLARHEGAEVVAVTSSASKCDALRSAGAQHVVVSENLAFADAVRKAVGGVDVALEIVGSATFAQTLKAMAPGGRVVVVGNLDTGVVELNPGLVIVKELEILGAYATTKAELQEAFALVQDGVVRPFVSEIMGLGEAARAHTRLEHRDVAGRLVLQP